MRKRWRFAAVAVAAVQLASVALAQQVRTESGVISGVREGGLSVYKGVLFAAPPVGELRWRPPTPVASWAGTRKADAFAPACVQQGVSMPGETPPAVSEDCLYLNIWGPAHSVSEHLPVFAWIYGGGYTNGSASMPLYWGDRLAHKGVIVVTIAYRLGPLGFLALPELTRESLHASSGNYGLMDQIAALEWVRRNIAAFGGDPKRVTIAEQSSGAISVSVLMASQRAKGLFQRAIGESGGLFEPIQLAPRYLLANAERDGEKYAASLGVASLQELRRLPAAKLIDRGNAGGVTHPVIEPYVLPVSPYEAFASGRQNDVPLLIGSTAEEARALTDVTNVKAATFAGDIERSFGQLPPQIAAAYPHAADEQARQARLDLERDLRFGWDMWALARLQAGTGLSRAKPILFFLVVSVTGVRTSNSEHASVVAHQTVPDAKVPNNADLIAGNRPPTISVESLLAMFPAQTGYNSHSSTHAKRARSIRAASCTSFSFATWVAQCSCFCHCWQRS
jgi:para-nitrobenzyl esterase